jgi:hypothetical protein
MMPLTESEHAELHRLIREGAKRLPPGVGNRLLLLAEYDRRDRDQMRRSAAGQRVRVERLRQRLAALEQSDASHTAD